jgi:hypothetical protein
VFFRPANPEEMTMNENTVLNQFVDALREVAAAIDRAVEEGERSAQISAHDLVEALLAVADRLDPPFGL